MVMIVKSHMSLYNQQNILYLLKIKVSVYFIMRSSIFSVLILILLGSSFHGYAQELDSNNQKEPYPYTFPILGKKAYDKGYKLPLPHGVLLGTIYNKQGIEIDNFEMAIAEPSQSQSDLSFTSLDGILDFGPSEGRIHTLNARIDTWVLPFLSISGIMGRVWGEQSISFSVVGSDFFESVTDIEGQYFGINLLGVVPLGPINLAADYSWTWTTNKRLDEPVLVKVAGIRVIKQIRTNKPDRFIAVWAGAQSQNLTSQTSGNIAFSEALGISEQDRAQLDNHWNNVLNDEVVIRQAPITGNDVFWSDLSPAEQELRQSTYNLVTGVVDSNVFYKFNKKLVYDWNMLLGASYQYNRRWGLKAEYGFLQEKQSFMMSVDYRFGL
jgi:hypothetical protein